MSVAVITGGASGFGRALGERCAARHMDVVLCDLDGERATEAASALAAQHAVVALGMTVDVSDSASVEAAAAAIGERFGAVDLVVSNVGVQLFGAVERFTDAEWRWVLDVNVIGSARVARAFLPLLRRAERGRLAFTTSSSVLDPGARLGAYQASKFAVWGLAETLRLELAEDGIAVSVIFPSGMASRHLETSEAAQPEHLRRPIADEDDFVAMVNSNPAMAASVATPEDAARSVIEAIFDDAPYIVTHGDLVDAVTARADHLVRAARAASDADEPGDAVEAIKQLKARYFRTMDTKDWAAMRQVFADDVVIDTTGSGGGIVTGADEFMDFLKATLGEAVTVHHGHMPEIEMTGPTTASGTWALQDLIIWPDGTRLDGYGHYHETYRLIGERWCIATSTLTRLHMDLEAGTAPPSPLDDASS
jgi:NAD(P)-dependent dehydrogenase (short-subunit alcohol dehydrogenase family)